MAEEKKALLETKEIENEPVRTQEDLKKLMGEQPKPTKQIRVICAREDVWYIKRLMDALPVHPMYEVRVDILLPRPGEIIKPAKLEREVTRPKEYDQKELLDKVYS